MVMNFGFVKPGKLAGCAHPGWSGQLRTSLEELASHHGVTAILTLCEEALEPDEVKHANMTAYHLPIPDFGTPNLDEMAKAMQFIKNELDQDGCVVVHCAAGIGRTGMVLACSLVSLDKQNAQEAINTVRHLRPGSIETPQQEALVAQWEKRLAKSGK